MNGITHVRPGDGFVPNFPLTEKIKVNGEGAHPLWSFIRELCPSPVLGYRAKVRELFYEPLHQNDIRWNWEKILINKEGKPVRRYAASLDPQFIAEDIEATLKGEELN